MFCLVFKKRQLDLEMTFTFTDTGSDLSSRIAIVVYRISHFPFDLKNLKIGNFLIS